MKKILTSPLIVAEWTGEHISEVCLMFVYVTCASVLVTKPHGEVFYSCLGAYWGLFAMLFAGDKLSNTKHSEAKLFIILALGIMIGFVAVILINIFSDLKLHPHLIWLNTFFGALLGMMVGGFFKELRQSEKREREIKKSGRPKPADAFRKKILYLDMDGVVADFDKAIKTFCPDLHTANYDDTHRKVDEICETNSDIFHNLPPIKGAMEAVSKLFDLYDVYFLSTPMWNVPDSYTGKRIWIEKHFGTQATQRLILTHRKDLAIGDFLVDDRTKNGVSEFTGIHIHFGTEQFPDWDVTFDYLQKQA